jgi:hypothetical protein
MLFERRPMSLQRCRVLLEGDMDGAEDVVNIVDVIAQLRYLATVS